MKCDIKARKKFSTKLEQNIPMAAIHWRKNELWMNLCILKQQCSEISKSAFAIGTDNFCLEVIRGHEISVSHIFFLDNIFFLGQWPVFVG